MGKGYSDEVRQDFNCLLREIRKERGLKQIEIARTTGISKQMVSKMESPDGNPSLEVLMRYCLCIGIDLEDAVRFLYQQNVDERIKYLEELLEVYKCMLQVRNQREGYQRYLEYWRDKNGRSELDYPDADEIYKEFWELKDGIDKLEKPL